MKLPLTSKDADSLGDQYRPPRLIQSSAPVCKRQCTVRSELNAVLDVVAPSALHEPQEVFIKVIYTAIAVE